MNASAPSHRMVVHLSGETQDAILPQLACLLDRVGLRLADLFQSRLDDSILIGAVVESSERESEQRARRALDEFASAQGLHWTLQHSKQPSGGGETHCRVCITLLGNVQSCRAIAEVGNHLVERGFMVEDVRSFGNPSLRGVELIGGRYGRVSPVEFRELRADLLALGPQLGIDLAMQRDDFYRRSKRLLCMDVDSTFVKGEFIDELAELMGVKQEVAEITARAMRGELDFAGALRQRVKLLQGLPYRRARELCDRFELTPGADDLVRTVKQLGMRVGLVSGGFDFFVEMLKERYGLDFAFANELEVEDGVLTGNVAGTIVDGQRKAQVLKDMAHVFGIRMEQTIAAGDGANDIQMLQAAGLGIAYQAKPRLQEVADTQFNQHDRLDTLLYLMGFDPAEAVGACR